MVNSRMSKLPPSQPQVQIVMTPLNSSGHPDPHDNHRPSGCNEDGYAVFSSLPLPYAASLFVPVFVTHASGEPPDKHQFILDHADPVMDDTFKDSKKYRPYLVFLETQNARYILSPTIDPGKRSGFQSPFKSWTLKEVFDAWMGVDRRSKEMGFLPLRGRLGDSEPKTRIWTTQCFVILDLEGVTMPKDDLGVWYSTVLMCYLPESENSFDKLQTIRCDFRILRFVLQLDSGTFDIEYARQHMTNVRGHVYFEDWIAWIEDGQPGLKELGIASLSPSE